MTPDQEEHLLRIATPLALGLTLGKDALGYEMQVKPHHEFLEDRVLDAVLDTEQRFIAISVGPRLGKTTLLGQLLPLWYLGMFPDNQVMYASYGEDRSKTIGRWVRDTMKHYGRDLFGHGVSTDSSSATSWRVDGHQGGMLSVGRGGPILGEPGHLIVCDDLFKGPEEADSAATRKSVKTWYTGTLRNRLEPGGTIVLFFQRWRLDDLIGDLKEQSELAGYGGDHWEFYNIPSLAEAPGDLEDEDEIAAWRDELGRKDGEALWPERYPRESLLRLRGNDPVSFQCVHQGDPRPGSGGWFPEERWVEDDEEIPPMVDQARIWDLAATKDGGDWTVGMKLGRDEKGDLWVLDVQRFRKHPDEAQKDIRATAQADGNHIRILIEQERSGSGTTVLAMYKRYLVGFTVEPALAKGTKAERAKPANEFHSMGRCHIPAGAHWAPQFKKELAAFQKQKTDDQVDAFSYGFKELVAMGTPMEMWTPDIYMPMSPAELAGAMGQFGY